MVLGGCCADAAEGAFPTKARKRVRCWNKVFVSFTAVGFPARLLVISENVRAALRDRWGWFYGDDTGKMITDKGQSARCNIAPWIWQQWLQGTLHHAVSWCCKCFQHCCIPGSTAAVRQVATHNQLLSPTPSGFFFKFFHLLRTF